MSFTFICERCGELVRCSHVVYDILCEGCKLDDQPEMTPKEIEAFNKELERVRK